MEALKIFGRLRSETILEYGLGGLSSEIAVKSPSDLEYLLAHALSDAIWSWGWLLALSKRKVVVMEGDGSALSGLTALPTVATVGAANLVHVIWDNGTWFSSGTMGTKGH